MDRFRIDAVRERIEQVGAMKRIRRSPEARFDVFRIAKLEKLTRLHVSRVKALKTVADLGDLFAEPDRLQRLIGLRTGAHRCADLAQGRRRLENVRRNSKFGKSLGRRQPPESATNDRDRTLHGTLLVKRVRVARE